MVYTLELHTATSRRLERDGKTVLFLVFAADQPATRVPISEDREREAAELASRIVSLLNRWSGERKNN